MKLARSPLNKKYHDIVSHELGKPNKLLGQNFLTSRQIAKRIVDAANLTSKDIVLEVGPGKGVLTELLLEKAGWVVAVEKDPRLVEYLREKFKDRKNLELIEGDILKIIPLFHDIVSRDIKVVANIPYYITSHLIRLFLEDVSRKPKTMILMVQKEVAERIVEHPPKMNLLAISVQAYATPKILFHVSRGNFSPAPNVDSSVIAITNISDAFFKKNKITSQDFFKPIKKAFSQKRKMLRGSLGIAGDYATKRPQELTLENWVEILKLN